MLAKRDLMRVVADQPLCPSYGKRLQFTPRSGGRTDPQTYGCQECGVLLMEAANQPIPHGGEHH